MMRRAQSGFTIVEFVIAVAISVVLVSVGVPRYNTFIQRQDFIGSSQRLVSCIQQAQRAAIGPSATGGTIRYTELSLSQNNDATYSCVVASFNSAAIPQQVATLYTDSSIDKMIITNMAADGTSYELNYPVRLVFGVLENGAPVQLYSALTQVKSASSGRGFTFQLSQQSTELNGYSSQVSVERLGAPVQVSVQNP
jgi:prepilin-type N-terminal cleavage/methylation domain-containing protein